MLKKKVHAGVTALLNTFAISDAGKEREVNEDYFGYLADDFGSLFIVCDGMGGNVGGDLAARTAVNTILEHFSELPNEYHPQKELQAAFSRANTVIRQMADEDPSLRGMGSTAASVLIIEDNAYLAHLGDSRVYIFRRGKLFQLTKDHSMVQHMVDKKKIKPSKAANHELKHLITKALGPLDEVSAETAFPFQLYNDDILLLCSDGLTNELTDKQIRNILRKYPIKEAAEHLLQEANASGGKDNITVQLVEISGIYNLPDDYKDQNPVTKHICWAWHSCFSDTVLSFIQIVF